MLNEHSLTVIEGDAQIADVHVHQVLGYCQMNDLHALIRTN